jgi:uncharacterized membrane protein
MKPSRSILLLLLVLFTFFSLIAGKFFFDLSALAQKTSINKDGTQTTSEPDNTYGEGGTKETVRDSSGRTIKVVKKDKDKKPRSAVTYLFPGNKECRYEKTWIYDSRGRLVSFLVEWINNPCAKKENGKVRRTIKYSDDGDTTGTQTDQGYDSDTGEWKPASESDGPIIDSGLKPDPDHDYSPDKPQSIIGDLEVKPTASPSPSPSPERSPKFKLDLKYNFKFSTSPGLDTETFTLPTGTKISVNFPDDLSAGDTFTGSVQTEVAGKDEQQRARNQSELDKIVLQIGGQPTRATEKMFTRTIPANLNAGPEAMPCILRDCPYLVLIVSGKQVGSATVPIANNPPPTPQNTQLPTCGQMGRNVVVTDHCDGIIAPTDSCTVGGVPLRPLAESPRMRVMQNTSQTPGPTQIKYVEQDREVTGLFQNLGVNITSPNTNLLRNQKTTMEVVALVQGIQNDVSLDVVNDTPEIVSISGGNNQHFTIHPSDVQTDGTYHRTFTVTANQAGAWGATATVSCEGGPGGQIAVGPRAAGSPTNPGRPEVIAIVPTPTPSPGGHAPPTPTPTPHPGPSPCASPPPSTTYSVKDLSTLSESDTAHCVATGINDGGNVVGACSPSYFGKSGGAWHAFRTEPGAVITKEDELALPLGITGGSSFATAVNGKGHVVGFWAPIGSSDIKAFWHDGGKLSKMTSLHPAKSIFTISKAFALNTSDDVVGVAYGPTVMPGSALGITFGGHAVLWPHADPASIIDLNDYMDPSSKTDWILIAAFGINDAKEIVGRALDLHLGKYHAFLLKSKGVKPIDLGALKEDIYDSSAAYAINTCGETVPLIDKVVGYTYTKKDAHYGFVWTEGVGMKDMGTLTGYLESYAQAINKKGEVVGAVGGLHTSVIFDAITCLGTCFTTSTGDAKNHGVWYNGTDLKDLNKLIPGYPGYEIEVANGINDKGQIVGSAFYKPPTYKSGGLYAKAVLLTPAGLTLPGPVATTTTTSTACPLSIPSGGYIFDNWNICGVKNAPMKDTTFTIAGPYLITFIATYHWNYGKGALPTKGISLKDGSGKVYGPWPVTTSAGSGGAANVNWECHPGITLPAGTYTVIDPDPATWSQNDGSGNSGFVRVAGSAK